MDLSELADSIRERGIIQPILVRPLAGVRDTFEIVAGERRWRAAQQAGLHTVPVIPLDVGDREALEIAIVENIQRADLNALEEAAGYARLAVEYGYTQTDIARVVGKSRSHIANMLRLPNLPAHAQELLSSGAISAGHARALLALPDPDLIADQIVAQGLSVRQTESLSKNPDAAKRSKVNREPENDPNLKSLAEQISLLLGVQINIQKIGQKHEMRIKTNDAEQLNLICERLIRV
jgi:ParB family transcriptional regulator, chromosome partitioning protein